MLFAKAGWQVSKPRPVELLGEPIQWVDIVRYLGVILDTRMTWSPHIVHVRKKAAQRLGLLRSLLHRRSGLSIRKGVLLYKQVLQSKCLHIATGEPWYIRNVQILEDLGVPFFAEHIRTLTEGYDSKLAGVGNPLFVQLGRYLRLPIADPRLLAAIYGD